MKKMLGWVVLIGIGFFSYFAFEKVESRHSKGLSQELDDCVAAKIALQEQMTLTLGEVKKLKAQKQQISQFLLLAFPDSKEQISEILDLDDVNDANDTGNEE